MSTSQVDKGRVICFRAWDTVANKMYFPDDFPDQYLMMLDCTIFDLKGRDPFGQCIGSPVLNRFKLMQLTRLPCMSGKDVFEGDIVKYGMPYHGEITTVLTGFITYNEHCGVFQIAYKNNYGSFVTDFAYKFTILDVIGNLHQDKHLLE